MKSSSNYSNSNFRINIPYSKNNKLKDNFISYQLPLRQLNKPKRQLYREPRKTNLTDKINDSRNQNYKSFMGGNLFDYLLQFGKNLFHGFVI